MLTFRQMDSIVQNNLLIFKGFKVERREESTNIFYDVYDNPKSGERFLGTYRVWEWHDGSSGSQWMPLDTNDPEIMKIRDTVWQAIMVIAVPANLSMEHEAMQPTNIDKESITWGELESRIEAGDKEAIELEEKLSKELQPLLRDLSIIIKQVAFSPLELAVFETLVKKDMNSSPTARVAVGKMTLGEIKTIMPKIVRTAHSPTINQSEVQLLRPNGFEIYADNTAGTALFKRDEQGNITEVHPAPNPGWNFEVSQRSIAAKPDSQIRLNHTTGNFQPGLYSSEVKDTIIKVTSETPLGLTSDANAQEMQDSVEKSSDTRQRGKSGRPNLPGDIWAWEQVNKLNRPMNEVYREWIVRDDVKSRNLQDPQRQFNRITKPMWRNKSGQNI